MGFRHLAGYEAHRGHPLPGDTGLERELIGHGVSAKQADKARQAFQRSAKQAGFFDTAGDRLVRPSVPTIDRVPTTVTEEIVTPPTTPSATGLALRADLAADPLLIGFLNQLPTPGEPFTKAEREKFKAALDVAFGYVYKDVPSKHGETEAVGPTIVVNDS